MVPRRYLVYGLAVLLAAGLAAVAVRKRDGGESRSLKPEPAGIVLPADEEAEAEAEARAGGEEAEGEEEEEETAERLEALAEAKASGKFGAKVAATETPAEGWVGSQVLNPATDDWEPAVATDPKSPYVYLLTTRYGEPKTCSSHCPTPYIVLTRSTDGGSTWGSQAPLCVCRGSKAQYDPTIEVVPNTGAVYSVFLNADRAGGFSAVFSKSTNHGKTWSTPVHVYGNVAWTDKPEVATSADGKDVYVSWNGPQGGDLYVGQSHDYGATWTQQKLSDTKRYYYAYDARVLADGTVVFSESSIVYSGSTSVEGDVWHHAIVSRDQGSTWENVVVAQVPVGEACVADGCSPDFYIGQTSVVSDAPGHLVFAYEGPTTADGPQQIYTATSSDEGRTWSAGTPLSAAGENSTGPRLASGGGGDVRVWYMQTADGDDPDAWNVWYRSSPNGGRTWSSPTKIDDAPAGAAGYVSADGFAEVYGDYGEIAVTSAGKTIATWGEGFSYTGPGGTWFNVER
ncbi:MAG TPA: sialidase family protein [Gaiellaceae bacterium]|nr:sialidase family protein [Gaiellaceae bacterium]